MVLALLFPTSGLMRGLNAIVRNFSSSWRRDETSLEKACKAGALCVVVRNANWRPKPGQANISAMLVTVEQEASLEQPHNTDVHDIESARLITPYEAEDATSTFDPLGERNLEQTLINLRPIGKFKHVRPDNLRSDAFQIPS